MLDLYELSKRFHKFAQVEKSLAEAKVKINAYLRLMSEALSESNIGDLIKKADLVESRGWVYSQDAEEGLNFCKHLVSTVRHLEENLSVLGIENCFISIATLQRGLVAQSSAAGSSEIKKSISNFRNVYKVYEEIYDLKNSYSDHQRTNEWLRADHIDGPFAKLTGKFVDLNKICKDCVAYMQTLSDEGFFNLKKKLTKKEVIDYLVITDNSGLESGKYDPFIDSKPSIKDLINMKFREGVKQVVKPLQWQQEKTVRLLLPELELINEHEWDKVVRNEDEGDFRGAFDQFSLNELLRQYYNSRDRSSYMSRSRLSEIKSRVKKIKAYLAKKEKAQEHLSRPADSLAPLDIPKPIRGKNISQMSAEERAEEFRLKSRKDIEEELEKLEEPQELEFE